MSCPHFNGLCTKSVLPGCPEFFLYKEDVRGTGVDPESYCKEIKSDTREQTETSSIIEAVA